MPMIAETPTAVQPRGDTPSTSSSGTTATLSSSSGTAPAAVHSTVTVIGEQARTSGQMSTV